MTMHHRAATALAVLTLAGVLTACGDDTASSEGSTDPSAVRTASNGDVFNSADVQFASDMIVHHAQAIEMVTLSDGRPLDPEVAEVAGEIRDAQAPEVEVMVDWLTAWGEEVPETSLDHANAEDHDVGDRGDLESMDTGEEEMGVMSGMPGMMSAEEMSALAEAPDTEFQDLWLEMMIEHHTGAIEMAQAEQADGEYADSIALAETIESGQQAELELMNALLGA